MEPRFRTERILIFYHTAIENDSIYLIIYCYVLIFQLYFVHYYIIRIYNIKHYFSFKGRKIFYFNQYNESRNSRCEKFSSVYIQ